MEFLIILLFILIGGYFLWQTGNRNWKELYTTQDVEEYMKIVGQLQNAKINYRTTSGGEEFNFRQGAIVSRIPPVSYTIWVEKADFYKAERILQSLSSK